MHAAIRSDGVVGLEYCIANDAANWWALIGEPGEGIAAPKGVSSFKITVEGSGYFRFDYTLAGGAWTVKVDGVVEPAYRASVRNGRLYAGRPLGVVIVVR